MVFYTVKKLADLAGISVRTLHYYDQTGLLKPESRSGSGYRRYGEEAVLRLQQIMFFKELDFSLDEIKTILSRPDFDVVEALQSHRNLLLKRAGRINRLVSTVDKTINKLKGKENMEIKEYYEGFSDEQVEKYRREVRQRWGEGALKESEARVLAMGKNRFNALQAEGMVIFKNISENMPKGFASREVQEQVSKWRRWLENFYHYSDEAALGLGQMYSRHPEFAEFYRKINIDLPQFLTQAIEYYFEKKK
jgi:MerR family transcriptional regulator, thiopeptide resistance regulator